MRSRLQAHRNQVPLVLLPDGSGQVMNPLPGDVGAGPVGLVQCDELDEMLTTEGRPQPVAVPALATGHVIGKSDPEPTLFQPFH